MLIALIASSWLNDALVQLVFQLQQALGLFLLQPGERHAGHLADDLADDLLVHDAVHLLGLLLPVPLHLLLLGAERLGLVAQPGGFLVLGVLDRLVLLDAQPLDLLFQLGQIRRLGHAAEADAGARLVQHVDRLVRQAAAGDVAVAHLDGRQQRLVLDLDAVVRLVAVAQALEDLDGVFLARRVHRDRLEPPGQGGVLLDVLAVLVEGGGADALDLAAAQGGLEHVAGVDRAFGAAGADQRVQLVDEEDDVLGPPDLVHHGLDALLELAAVLGAGDHHRQVQHDQPAVVQDLRDAGADDHLGQALDDGGLADAGLAQEDGVVLLPAAEDLDDALDLVLAADDRIELAFFGQFGQVAAEAVQGGGLALAFLALFFLCGFFGFHACSQKVENFLPHLFQLQRQVHQDLRGDAVVLAEQAQQQVLGADVIVIQVARLFDGVLDDLLGPGGLGQLAHGDHVRAALDELLDFEAYLAQVHVQVLQDVGADAGAFLDQPEQDVLGADVLVVESLGLLVGQRHDLSGPIREPFKHVHLLSAGGAGGTPDPHRP